MRLAREIVLLGCAAALTVCLCLAVLDGRALIKAQFGAAQREAEKTRQQVLAEVGRQSAAIRGDLFPRVDAALSVVDRRTGDALAAVNGATDKLDKRLQVIDGAAPVLAGLDALLASANANLADGRKALEQAVDPADVAGVLRDTRFFLARAARTAGHVEQASDDFRASVPEMLAIWKSVGLNIELASNESAKTAAESRNFMAHLSEMTKPLPSWARIGLAVAPPIVQTGFTVGSWLTLRGKAK